MIKNICAGLLILCQSTFDFQKDFEYNNNEEFIAGVKNCALFYNADLPAKDRIPIEITSINNLYMIAIAPTTPNTIPERTNNAKKIVSLSSPVVKYVKPKKIKLNESTTVKKIIKNISNANLYDSIGSSGAGGFSNSSAMNSKTFVEGYNIFENIKNSVIEQKRS